MRRAPLRPPRRDRDPCAAIRCGEPGTACAARVRSMRVPAGGDGVNAGRVPTSASPKPAGTGVSVADSSDPRVPEPRRCGDRTVARPLAAGGTDATLGRPEATRETLKTEVSWVSAPGVAGGPSNSTRAPRTGCPTGPDRGHARDELPCRVERRRRGVAWRSVASQSRHGPALPSDHRLERDPHITPWRRRRRRFPRGFRSRHR